MRVGINASFLRKPFTGIGQVTLHFLRSIPESDRVEYVLYTEEPLDPAISLPSHFVQRNFLPLWKRDDLVRQFWWERYSLPQAASRDECDVFLSLYQSSSIFPSSIRHVMLVHDIIPKLFPEYLNNARKRFVWRAIERGIRGADRLVTVSSRTEKDLIRHLRIQAGIISVNHIDVNPIFKRPVTDERSAQVLRRYHLSPGFLYFGGGLEVRKNAEGVLRAYKRLLDFRKADHTMPPVPPLVLSGKLLPHLAPLVTDVERLVRELNLSPFVRILGFVPQEDLPALYRNAKLFFFPSRYEGFGLPILEAMNVGAPVLTSKMSSLPEVARDAALYCHPDDIDDMARTLRSLLLSDTLQDTLVRRGHARAAQFSWEHFSRKLLHILTGDLSV